MCHYACDAGVSLFVSSAGMSGVSGMNDGGELVMNDGRVIGHRALAVYYRQSLRPTALISSLSGVYRALALPGYAQNAAQVRVRM